MTAKMLVKTSEVTPLAGTPAAPSVPGKFTHAAPAPPPKQPNQVANDKPTPAPGTDLLGKAMAAGQKLFGGSTEAPKPAVPPVMQPGAQPGTTTPSTPLQQNIARTIGAPVNQPPQTAPRPAAPPPAPTTPVQPRATPHETSTAPGAEEFFSGPPEGGSTAPPWIASEHMSPVEKKMEAVKQRLYGQLAAQKAKRTAAKQPTPTTEPTATPTATPQATQAFQGAMSGGMGPDGQPTPEAKANLEQGVTTIQQNPNFADAANRMQQGQVTAQDQAAFANGAKNTIKTELGVDDHDASQLAGQMPMEQQMALWGGMGLLGLGLMSNMTQGVGFLPTLMMLLGGGMTAAAGGMGQDAQQGIHGMAAQFMGGQYDPELGLTGSLVMPEVERQFASSPEAQQARDAYNTFAPPEEPAADTTQQDGSWLGSMLSGAQQVAGRAVNGAKQIATSTIGGVSSQDDVIDRTAQGIRAKVEANPQYQQTAPWLGAVGGKPLTDADYRRMATRLLTKGK